MTGRLKGIVLLLAIGWSPSSFANHWLMGVEAAHVATSATWNVSIYPNGGFNTAPLFAPAQPAKNQGSLIGVWMGYEQFYKSAMATLELHVQSGPSDKPHSAQFSSNTASYQAQGAYQRGATIELSSRIGLITPRPFIPFIRLGATSSYDKINYLLLVSPSGNLNHAASNKHHQYGLLAGLGFEVQCFRDSMVPWLRTTALIAEYNYAQQQRFNYRDARSPINGEYSIRPTHHVWRVGLVWKQPAK